ncbi:MAG: helix-turn-helix domain-containing protein, partial [Tsuneonella sp.]
IGEAPAERGAGDAEALGEALQRWLAQARPQAGSLYHQALAAFERPLFEHALGRTGGNQLRAAKLLGINRNTLRKKLADLALDPDHFSPRA